MVVTDLPDIFLLRHFLFVPIHGFYVSTSGRTTTDRTPTMNSEAVTEAGKTLSFSLNKRRSTDSKHLLWVMLRFITPLHGCLPIRMCNREIKLAVCVSWTFGFGALYEEVEVGKQVENGNNSGDGGSSSGKKQSHSMPLSDVVANCSRSRMEKISIYPVKGM